MTSLLENTGGANVRVVQITAHITPPATTETEIDIPDDAGRTTPVEADAA